MGKGSKGRHVGLKGVIILRNGMERNGTEHSVTLFPGMERFVKQLFS